MQIYSKTLTRIRRSAPVPLLLRNYPSVLSTIICYEFSSSLFFFSSRRRHTRSDRDWSSDVCSSDLFADYPTVPMDKIVAQVNMDMVGRNRDNKSEEANTVYIVGSDRISTEFHNITEIGRASCRERV